jgi:D-sedoheptulose 7-phosphate isomerase
LSSYAIQFLSEAAAVCDRLDVEMIDRVVDTLVHARRSNGRVFFLGVGGSAANASHAVNDFRKIAGLECYAPTDNVAELTARTNDDGWDTVFQSYLETSRLRADDVVFVFSVGGGSRERGVSVCIVEALDYARSVGARIVGVVGPAGGYTREVGDAVVLIPASGGLETPLSEAFQAVVWHLIVTHSMLAKHDPYEALAAVTLET